MLRAGRPDDQEFAADEELYYRLDVAYEVGERPSGLSVRKPDFSVNRSKHGGAPEYVLLPDWPNHGIAKFHVKGLPHKIKSEGDRAYSWKPAHAPEEKNYHHSEIHTYKGTVRAIKSSQINDLVYREFRQRLSEAMIVIRSFAEPAAE